MFYKHTTSAYGGPKGGAFSDHWPEVYSSFPKSPSGRNINFFVSYGVLGSFSKSPMENKSF